jgi:sialate O-acetylesterase
MHAEKGFYMCRFAFVYIVFCAVFPVFGQDFASSPARPDRAVDALTLPSIFSDRMVLQRDKPVRIWGWAKAGATVSVAFAGQQKTAKADGKGAWQLELDALEASFENRPLSVSAGGKEIVLKDVLVGEVWVCGGQSNMAWTLSGSLDADVEIPSADYQAIRYVRLPLIASPTPEADYPVDASRKDPEGRWYPCQPQHMEKCTAVGYYFGQRLHRMLKVPVGLIDTSWGGTMAQHWVERSRLQPIPEMQVHFDKFAEAMKEWDDGGGAEGAAADYKKGLAEYEAAQKAWKEGQPKPRRPGQRKDPSLGRQPAGMVNGIIAPISGYSVKGVLFYQGENNSFGESWKPFHRTFPAVIDTFRRSFGNKDLPFGIIQIAGWSTRRSMSYDMNHHCNVVREIQFDVWRRTSNTGLIVSFDANSDSNIHPKRKQPVGERSARWALAEVYQAKGYRDKPIPWRGPIFEKMEVKDGKCVLYFDKASASGLRLNKSMVHGFVIAGEDKVFHSDVQGRADSKNGTVIVWSESVKAPVAVRYAQSNLPIGSILNGAELPAYPFRTDDWPITPHQSEGSYVRSKAQATQ